MKGPHHLTPHTSHRAPCLLAADSCSSALEDMLFSCAIAGIPQDAHRVHLSSIALIVNLFLLCKPTPQLAVHAKDLARQKPCIKFDTISLADYLQTNRGVTAPTTSGLAVGVTSGACDSARVRLYTGENKR